TIFSCGLSLRNESDQMYHKLRHESERDEDTANIRSEPAWVPHHFEPRPRRLAGCHSNFLRTHLILVKCKPCVSQRRVHVDFHFAIFLRLWIFKLHAAAKIFWSIRAGINRVRRFQKCERKRGVNASWPQRESKLLAAGFYCLRFGQSAHDPVGHLSTHLTAV